MENTTNDTASRIYVDDLSSIGGIRIGLKKQDGSEFSDSDVDKLFRKAFEYSECGPSSIQRFGSKLVVVFKDIQEGRDFIEDVASKNDNININKNINVIFSENHDTWIEVTLARREGGSFTDSEIQSIFWNAFQYTSLSSFSNYKNEVRLHFKDVWEWRAFIQQFAYEDGRSKLKFKESADKAKKKGFLGYVDEQLNKLVKWLDSKVGNRESDDSKNEN